MADDFKDVELMAQFNAGKAKAFEVVYDRYFARLYLVAFRLVRNREDAKDIVVMALNAAFEKYATYPDLPALSRFLFLRTRSRSIDYLRSKKTGMQITAEFTEVIEESEIANDELDTELVARLLESVQKLPARSREVIVLYYMHGLKYKEIAEKLQVSPRTVENQLRFALGRLREFLGNEHLAGTIVLLAAAACVVLF